MSQTVLIFQEEAVLAADGRAGKSPQIQGVRREALKGYGDPFGRWRDALSRLQEQEPFGEVQLVLPASMCATRAIRLPYAKGKMLAEMADREIRDVLKSEIMDYAVIQADKAEGVILCGAGVEEKVLEQFLDLCEEFEMDVKGITVPMEGYLRVLTQMGEYKNHTAVFLFFEEGIVTSVLLQEGNYRYSSRSRLFSEPGTLDFGTEIVRNISGILQFHAASKSESQITDVYYAGCPAEDFEVSEAGIRDMNLNVSPIDPGRRFPLPAGEKASNWLPCIGAMIRGDKSRKDLNLLQVFSQKLVVQTEKKFSWRELVLPVILILAALLVSGGVFISNLFLNHKIGKLQDWMEKPKVQEDYKTSQELQLHSRRLQATIRQIMRMEQNLATYPNLNSAVIQRIESVAGGKIELMITGYDAETGVLTFQAASPEVIDIPSYILKLQQTALFHSVDYTGYSYENDWYTLSLTGTLEGYEVGGEDE